MLMPPFKLNQSRTALGTKHFSTTGLSMVIQLFSAHCSTSPKVPLKGGCFAANAVEHWWNCGLYSVPTTCFTCTVNKNSFGEAAVFVAVLFSCYGFLFQTLISHGPKMAAGFPDCSAVGHGSVLRLLVVVDSILWRHRRLLHFILPLGAATVIDSR